MEFIQKSPWKVSMTLTLTGVRSSPSGPGKKGEVSDRADCGSFPGSALAAEVFHRVLVSLSSPLSSSVSGAFFLKN